MIPPNRSSRLSDWCEVSPFLFSNSSDVVDNLILGLGEQVRLREGRLWITRMGILAAKLGDDVVEVLL